MSSLKKHYAVWSKASRNAVQANKDINVIDKQLDVVNQTAMEGIWQDKGYT